MIDAALKELLQSRDADDNSMVTIILQPPPLPKSRLEGIATGRGRLAELASYFSEFRQTWESKLRDAGMEFQAMEGVTALVVTTSLKKVKEWSRVHGTLLESAAVKVKLNQKAAATLPPPRSG